MNIVQVFEKFPTQEDCITHLEQARWDSKTTCPYCGSTNTTRNQHRHRCYNCKTSFSVTVGTIFHHTPAASEVVLGNHAHVKCQEGTIRTSALP